MKSPERLAIERYLQEYQNNKTAIGLLRLEISGIEHVLDLEIEKIIDVGDIELIESLCLQSPRLDGIHLDSLLPSDITANIAERYHEEKNLEIIEDELKKHLKTLETKIFAYQKQVNTVDILLTSLKKEERWIVEKFYMDGCTWEEITKEYATSFPYPKNKSSLRLHVRGRALEKMTEMKTRLNQDLKGA